jgi:hypothetical protein
MAEPGDPFLGLDASEAVELGELLAFLSDWLACDPNRIDASLHDFVGGAGPRRPGIQRRRTAR